MHMYLGDSVGIMLRRSKNFILFDLIYLLRPNETFQTMELGSIICLVGPPESKHIFWLKNRESYFTIESAYSVNRTKTGKW